MARFTFTRWGIAENPIGAQVKFKRDGREHLADVVDCYKRDTPPRVVMLRLRYFNGEDAGEMAAAAVEVLER